MKNRKQQIDVIDGALTENEVAWVRRQKEEANSNAFAPIVGYSRASAFELEAAFKLAGDEMANLEMIRRCGFGFDGKRPDLAK